MARDYSYSKRLIPATLLFLGASLGCIATTPSVAIYNATRHELQLREPGKALIKIVSPDDSGLNSQGDRLEITIFDPATRRPHRNFRENTWGE